MPTHLLRTPAWVFFVTLLVGAAATSLRAQSALSEKDKDRLVRLERLASALEKVKIDRVQSTGDREAAGRRLSSRSEMHMRFLTAAGTLAENGKDGLCVFPIQVSGFSGQINSTKGLSDRQSGADMQRATIALRGLIGEPRPKVKVDLAALNHGSKFPADQLARDRIHDLVRLYFPEAEIEGMQRYFEKTLEIRNETEEPVRVWVYGRTWDRSHVAKEGSEAASVGDQSSEGGPFVWLWRPGTPPRAKPFEINVPAGDSEKVTYDEAGGSMTLSASRVLIWAESESGETWREHKQEPLWLIEPNPQQDGERTYHAERIATYGFTIKPKPGPRVFTERVLEFKNDSSEELAIHLRYRTMCDGSLVWKEMDATVPPKQSLRPRDSHGGQIRASQVLFEAVGENRKFIKHSQEPFWLVEEQNGRRAYAADKIGAYVYVLESGAAGDDGMARITGSRVPVFANGRTLAYLNEGEQYRVVDSDDEDILIKFTLRGRSYTGWVSRRNAKMGAAPAPAAPSEIREALRITAGQTDIRVGDSTIGQVHRNETYHVLAKKDGWARIEVKVDGILRHAWVNQRYTQSIQPDEVKDQRAVEE